MLEEKEKQLQSKIQQLIEEKGPNLSTNNLNSIHKLHITETQSQNISGSQNFASQESDPCYKIYGDPITGNLNQLIFNNILSCQYFKEDVAFKGFNEILAEIVQNVTYAEPWAVGISGVPSTLFCCLYKLMIIKLTEGQINFLLTNRESPYIRCVGFLYLRYLTEPKELWKRLSKYIFDEENFTPTANTKIKITIGEYVENLLKDYDYYGTRLPKIPTQIEREVKAKLLLVEEKRERKRKNVEKLNVFSMNTSCSAVSFQDDNWHDGVIISIINNNRQVYVRFLNGSDELMNMYESYKTENKRENFEIIKSTYHQLADDYLKNNLKVPFFNSEEIVDLGDVEIIQKEKIHVTDYRAGNEIEYRDNRLKSKERKNYDSSYSRSRSRSYSHRKKNKRRHRSSSKRSSRSSSSSSSVTSYHRHRHRHRDHKKSHRHRTRHSLSRSRSRSISSDYYKKKETGRGPEKSKEKEKK